MFCIAFIGTRDIAIRLQSPSAFRELIDVCPVTDSDRLVRKYLSKERTPQGGLSNFGESAVSNTAFATKACYAKLCPSRF